LYIYIRTYKPNQTNAFSQYYNIINYYSSKSVVSTLTGWQETWRFRSYGAREINPNGPAAAGGSIKVHYPSHGLYTRRRVSQPRTVVELHSHFGEGIFPVTYRFRRAIALRVCARAPWRERVRAMCARSYVFIIIFIIILYLYISKKKVKKIGFVGCAVVFRWVGVHSFRCFAFA